MFAFYLVLGRFKTTFGCSGCSVDCEGPEANGKMVLVYGQVGRAQNGARKIVWIVGIPCTIT